LKDGGAIFGTKEGTQVELQEEGQEEREERQEEGQEERQEEGQEEGQEERQEEGQEEGQEEERKEEMQETKQEKEREVIPEKQEGGHAMEVQAQQAQQVGQAVSAKSLCYPASAEMCAANQLPANGVGHIGR
jgi:hypothetical protein